MDWNSLLTRKRLGRRDEPISLDVRSEFQRDGDRIVYSSAFRRLQDKTQVFPLAKSDYVRTRLTHSIEVSTVGRSLGTLIGDLVNRRDGLAIATPAEFGALVAAACLAHDIGNPPFGHSGEDAIREWFQDSSVIANAKLSLTQMQDLKDFEGNAQGFRVLTRLQHANNPGGLQLTCATLAAFTKYPCASRLENPERQKDRVAEKKFGFFEADYSNFSSVAEGTGLIRLRPNSWCRHPLAFLVEAADDICYRIIDLEDGHRVGRMSSAETEKLLLACVEDAAITQSDSWYVDGSEKSRIEFLRAKAINAAISAVVDSFDNHYDDIMTGAFHRDLVSVCRVAAPLEAIKLRSITQIYRAPDVVEIEAAGFRILRDLLELFAPALVSTAPSKSQKKLLEIVPAQYKIGTTDYEKLLSATDFVSGMTDSFAMGLFRKITGIEMP